MHIRRASLKAVVTFLLYYAVPVLPAPATPPPKDSNGCRNATDPLCCPFRTAIQAALFAALPAAAPPCNFDYNSTECCTGMLPIARVASIPPRTPQNPGQVLTCNQELYQAVASCSRDDLASLIITACNIQITLPPPGPPALACPISDPDQFAAVVSPQVGSACAIVAPSQACSGVCWGLIMLSVNGVLGNASVDPELVTLTRAGCVKTMAQYLYRIGVAQEVANALYLCPVTNTTSSSVYIYPMGIHTCPIGDPNQISQVADMRSVYLECSDATPPEAVCTKCVAALYKASSMILQSKPDLQYLLPGGCLIQVMSVLADGLPFTSGLIDEIQNCLVEVRTAFPNTTCPASSLAGVAPAMLANLRSSCTTTNLLGGNCKICKGGLLPAALSIPGLDPLDTRQLAECVKVVIGGMIASATGGLESSLTTCFSDVLPSSLVLLGSPYIVLANSSMKFPQLPLVPPRVPPSPPVIILPPPPPIITENASTVNPNLSPSGASTLFQRRTFWSSLAFTTVIFASLLPCCFSVKIN